VTENASQAKPAQGAAIRLLAVKRLTKAHLIQKLRDRGYPPADIEEAVSDCERLGYVDDRTFAQLYVKSILDRKAVGRMRLLRELLKQGVDGELAHEIIDECTGDDVERIDRALAKLEAMRPQDSYGQLGRRLERLGFAAPEIFRALRKRAETRGFKPETLEEFE